MASTAYATTADLSAYLRDVNTTSNAAIWTTLLSNASRYIDNRCGQYFYADGQGTKYWNGDGGSYLDTHNHRYYFKGGTIGAVSAGATTLTYTKMNGPGPVVGDIFVLDNGPLQETTGAATVVTGTSSPYTITVPALANAHAATTVACTMQLKLAYFENQPLANWLGPLAGDGITPDSNWWAEPANPGEEDSSQDTTALRPYYGIQLATIPLPGSNYLPAFLPGRRTVSVTAYWGWPVVPDPIKNLTLKLATRAWRSRDTGWTVTQGSPDVGVVDMSRMLDREDDWLLTRSAYVHREF